MEWKETYNSTFACVAWKCKIQNAKANCWFWIERLMILGTGCGGEEGHWGGTPS